MKVFRIYYLIAIIFFVCSCQGRKDLVILCTNDTHSQLRSNEYGMGGVARCIGLVNEQRHLHPDLLLLDAGDFSQGSVYYNFYRGRMEIDAMNRMGYDVVTLGNHEFDFGVDTLALILSKASFDIVCSNCDFSHTSLKDIIRPYVVIKRNAYKIGIFGLTVQFDQLVSERNCRGIIWKDPITVSKEIVSILREKEHCDIVVCLSHLGSEYDSDELVDDVTLAENVEGIDLIIGGHTHKLVNLTVKSPDRNNVRLVQTGRCGVRVAKVTFSIDNNC